MPQAPLFLMTDPSHFDVRYRINPWMKPEAWHADPIGSSAAATVASERLAAALRRLGARIETIPAVGGLPDLVFPANAAVVLDGRVLLARFRYPERQGEEPVFREAFRTFAERGLVTEIVELPAGIFQEGAGDCIWDANRSSFWAGYGPRSSYEALAAIEGTFARKVLPLELASERYYHLDTCFCPLSGGLVLYYPEAFTPAALATIHAQVPEELRIEASDAEAEAFCVNAINIGTHIVMAKAPESLVTKLEARGFSVDQVDLAPFILSGGASYCMTLRLDRTSERARAARAAESVS
jgi:N-dimethylarginine dimethylaminohydrolase